MRARQHGLSLMLVMVILVFAMLALLANVSVTRLGFGIDDRAATIRTLERAAGALEAFAAVAGRLPCPANPAGDDGLEVAKNAVAVGTTGLCEYPAGTLPWKSIGLSRAESFDAWDLKISYRVYTGNAGSLTQANGLKMTECDTDEPSSGAATSVDGATNTGRLCVTSATAVNRSTTPARFLAGKGLSLDDNGTTYADVAYVLISHGATGYGAYTLTGTRRTMPGGGDEERNTRETGAFTRRAFSDMDTEATKATHFDDLLVYRRLPELATRVGLAARDWPDHVAMVFDSATVQEGMGPNPPAVATGSIGRTSLSYDILTEGGRVSATVTGRTGSSDTNISYDDTIGGTGGIGVYGSPYFGYGINLLMSGSGELLRFDLSRKLRKFAITLNDFGQPTYFAIKFTERVEFKFYDTAVSAVTPVMTVTRSACREPDGVLASYSIDASADFDRVEVTPLTMEPILYGYPTGLLVSAFTACVSTAPSCSTPLATSGVSGNSCT